MCLNINCDVRLCLLCLGSCIYIIKEPISVKISAILWPQIFANVSASIEGMMRKSHVAPLGFGEGWQLSAKALFRQSDLAQTKNCERKIDRDNYVKKHFFEKSPIKARVWPTFFRPRLALWFVTLEGAILIEHDHSLDAAVLCRARRTEHRHRFSARIGRCVCQRLRHRVGSCCLRLRNRIFARGVTPGKR